MGIICPQCGDKGFSNAYIYCVKCLNFAVHRYCLDVIPETLDEFVYWVCDECEAENRNQSTVPNHRAIPSETRNDILSENVKSFSIVETKENNLLAVQTEDHVYKDVPDQLHDDCTKLDLIEYGESAVEHASLQVEGKSDDRAVVLLKDKGKKRRRKRKEKCTWMRQTPLLQCMLKKKKKKKRKRIFKSTVEKDEHNLGNKSSEQDYVERENLQIVLACYTMLPYEVKDDKGSEPRDQKCVSTKRLKKKKKTVITPAANLQDQIKDVKNGELEDREENNFAAWNNNNICEDFPKDSHISSAEPVAMPIWSGSFNIWNTKRDMLDGLMAHMSVQACQKVYDEACQFQPVLHLEMLPKSDVWPKSFDISEPRGENIALYFFPSEISERAFDHLVDEMVNKELALKAFVQNAELLIFTSTELPLLYWRFQGKNYLWGVFRAKQSTPSNSHPLRKELKDKNPIEHTEKTPVTTKRSNARSPCSPLSSSASYGSHTHSMLE